MKSTEKKINFYDAQGNNVTKSIEYIYVYKYFGDKLKKFKVYQWQHYPFIRVATEIDGKIKCVNGFFVNI
jgi:hypothetical protein